VSNNPYIITVGIHNGDDLEYENESTIRGAFGIDYFPSGMVGRVYLGSNHLYNGAPIDNTILNEIDRQLYNETVMAGVGIETVHSGSNVTIDVEVKFYEDITEAVGLTIYVMEDHVVSGTQENYFSGLDGYQNSPYYDEPAQLPGYDHRYVLRDVGTNINGDNISSALTVQNGTFNSNTYSMSVSGYKANDTYIIAFVHYLLNGTNKQIINAQQVKLGESVGINQIN
jgi:hypothetical protein